MTMESPKVDVLLGVNVVDLGGMIELSYIDINRLSSKMRWESIVDGEHKIYDPSKGKGLYLRKGSDNPDIEKYREEARKAFKEIEA
jgi:hypothetical protein